MTYVAVQFQVAEGRPVTDRRFFIRAIIRHTDFITAVSLADTWCACHCNYCGNVLFLQKASFDYMEREGERMFLEALDQLQLASKNLDEVH